MRHAQVAVVGAGPAGLGAAIAAARTGAQTVLLDEQLIAGGQLRYRVAEIPAGDYGNIRAMALADHLTNDAQAAGVDVRPGSVVWGCFADNILAVICGSASYQLQAERIIFATGSTDLPLPFPGGSLPGVFTARAVQLLINRHRVLPGRRFVIIGRGQVADEIASDIVLAGGAVAAHVETLHPDTLSAAGATGVETVAVDGRTFAADVIVLAIGRQPDPELALMAECAAGFSEELGGFVPLHDDRLQTSRPAIYCAGDAGGVCDVETALAEGAYAGHCVAASLGLGAEQDRERARAAYEAVAADRIRTVSQLESNYLQIAHDLIEV